MGAANGGALLLRAVLATGADIPVVRRAGTLAATVTVADAAVAVGSSRLPACTRRARRRRALLRLLALLALGDAGLEALLHLVVAELHAARHGGAVQEAPPTEQRRRRSGAAQQPRGARRRLGGGDVALYSLYALLSKRLWLSNLG